MLSDQPAWINQIIERVTPFTLTSPERVAALCSSVEYIVRNKIPGDFVECGVWKGGSVMAAALALIHFGTDLRRLHLFDTFAGMTQPDPVDCRARDHKPAADIMASADINHGIWCFCPIEEVRANVATVGYPESLINFVKGPVEETVPGSAPDEIALLRLDTDWYGPTKHELDHLYPRLSAGGVLIVDDYGHWEGARKATDEFIAAMPRPILLNRIDYTGRLALKTMA